MENTQSSGPFEGPEKLLELPDAHEAHDGKLGLRKVPRAVWEEMLDIVKCKILSVVEGTEMDAYLLSESSLFVSPHRLILKTCGTTLNLLGLPRILEIARTYASLPSVYRCFYSRKAFMFPERQRGPHRDWRAEVEYLDQIFPKVNGDHWLLYITTPGEDSSSSSTAPSSPITPAMPLTDADENAEVVEPADYIKQDYTIEILMTQLSTSAREQFHHASSLELVESNPGKHGLDLSSSIGISDLFPRQITSLDAYSFFHAAIHAGKDLARSGEGYYTIHVTPEEGYSYASFECNVPLPTQPSPQRSQIPDLKTLIRRVVNIFQPGRLTLTLFISSEDNANAEEEEGESAVETAQRAFRAALTVPKVANVNGHGAPTPFSGLYRRTDKINYEFGGYDLAFASFELRQ
ncbi:S-adenosylmethionine decarboxylase [Irpex lacteus]|nr:S-adenosylmethionine decarboxylase [Irpex lacteus]